MQFYQAVLASFVAAICASIVIWFIHRRLHWFVDLLSEIRLNRHVRKGLRRYLNHLRRRTLHIAHPWMKEGQTLGDILVPVALFVDRRIDLHAFLSATFGATTTPRIVIVGAPGSGKSIAIGEIARYLASLQEPRRITPVQLTFSDLKEATDKTDVEAVIADKLRRDQFTESKPDHEAPAHFISTHLYTGAITLLIDGYDELAREQRTSTAQFVCEFLSTYRKIPAVLTSRTAVYERENAFRTIATHHCGMAPLSPLAINRFVSQWHFDEGKSYPELLSHINGKAHLGELASNPLMLTIICFLYGQPKYVLPDNRVEFYRECCRALLERWDTARQTQRANRFEADHKIDVLSRIAHNHVSNRATADEEIYAADALKITRKALQGLSLNPSDDRRILREIVENSGLLLELSAEAYRFPHRTFLEFFTAVYLYEQEPVVCLIQLYEQDAARWRPALLMYAGLCRSRDTAIQLLGWLIEKFKQSSTRNMSPDITVFSALIETSVAAPETAEQIITLAEYYLSQNGPHQALIEEIAYIASNTKWIYAERARGILYRLLTQPLPHNLLQAVILASMRCRGDNEIRTLIAKRLSDLDLVEAFIQAGDQAAYYLSRLREIEIGSARKQQLVDGLREGRHLELLVDIMVESVDEELAVLAGWALLQTSVAPGFMDFLDHYEPKPFDRQLAQYVDTRLVTWGWHLPRPNTDMGRSIATAIAVRVANLGNTSRGRDEGIKEEPPAWLLFLIEMVVAEMASGGKGKRVAPIRALERVWRTCSRAGRSWNRLLRSAYIIIASLCTSICIVSSVFIMLISLLYLFRYVLFNKLFIDEYYFSFLDVGITFAICVGSGFPLIIVFEACLDSLRGKCSPFRESVKTVYGANIVLLAKISSGLTILCSLAVLWFFNFRLLASMLAIIGAAALYFCDNVFLVNRVVFGGRLNHFIKQAIWSSNVTESKTSPTEVRNQNPVAVEQRAISVS
jgi:hypothetical protein